MRGFWHSHMNWLFDHNSVTEKVFFFFSFSFYGLNINILNHIWCLRFWLIIIMETWQCGKPNNVGDLEKQPFYRFISKTYILHPVALGALLYALGGFPFLVWGMVRIPGLKLSLLLVHLT